MDPLDWLAAQADGSAFAHWSSATAYPVANVLHLLGLVLLVGGIGLVDLRIAGLFRSLPVRALSKALTPLSIAGLALMLLSGIVMFAADAEALARSDIFRRKLILIALALLNAGAFRWLWRDLDRPTLAARIMAGLSLILWLAVATHGRLIAYL